MKRTFITLLLAILCAGCSFVEQSLQQKDSVQQSLSLEPVILPQYDAVGPFCEGLARVGKMTETGMKYHFINEQGESIGKEYDLALDFSEGLALVGTREGDFYRCGYIDQTGQEVIPLQWLGDETEHCLSFQDGLAVIQQIIDGEVWYNLIDRNGNYVFEKSFISESGDSFAALQDPRLLQWVRLEKNTVDTVGKNVIQAARAGLRSFPVIVYDGGKTCWIDENLTIVQSIEGHVTLLEEGWSLVYDQNWKNGVLMNDEQEMVFNGVSSVLEGWNDELILCLDLEEEDQFEYHIYSKSEGIQKGPKMSHCSKAYDGYVMRMEDPLITRAEDGSLNRLWTYQIVDQDLNVLSEVQAENLYGQARYLYDFQEEEYRVEYAPFYWKTVNCGEISKTELIDASGKTIVEYQEGSILSVLNSCWIVRYAPNKQRAEVYDSKGNSRLTIEAIENLSITYIDGQEALCFSKEGKNKAMIISGTFNDMKIYEDEVYTDPLSHQSRLVNSEKTTLLKQQEASVVGTSIFTDPVYLQVNGEKIDSAAALSLPYKNIYLCAKQVDLNQTEDGVENAGAIGMSLKSIDGNWQSDVYEKLGILSEGYLAYCEGGQWGYLKVKED